MISFPNAKINIGLNVLDKRPDGFHNIESILHPVSYCDVLEIVISDQLEFKSSGIDIPGDSSENLCMKVYHLIKSDHDVKPVSIYLHKVIPIGAGLGGGSADGAFAINMLNNLFELNLSLSEKLDYASHLGSDCAFFIQNKPAMATNRGEELSDVNIDLHGYKLILLSPDIHVSTAEAYSDVVPSGSSGQLTGAVCQPIETWKDTVKNEFEHSVFAIHPIMNELKASLYERGALYASVTGSGSALYGIFNHSDDVQIITSGLQATSSLSDDSVLAMEL